MNLVQLGQSDLQVTPICMGTMTFGEQVNEKDSHAILDRSLEAGINFVDTAEMYAVPAKADTFGFTETYIGNWFAKNPGVRQKLVLATKVAGPSRGMPWIREGTGMSPQDIVNSCEASLRRLQTDVIDLYQIHWPARNVCALGMTYFDPSKDRPATSIHEQLEALAKLVKAGKIRYIGLSNETPYGVHEFIRLAEQYGLPRVQTVQNPYSLVNRTHDNGLDETCYRLNVSLLAYSPLGFGLLTGKYDDFDLTGPLISDGGRIARYESVRKQRWGRPDSIRAARRYSQLARDNGLTPTQMALAFCYQRWSVTSTIVGVTSVAQLDENLAAWATVLTDDVLKAIDAIRWDIRDPAL